MAKLTPFGIQLRLLRIKHEMRLFDLAEKLGKSTAMISAVETGRKPIPDGFVTAISRAMDLSAEEIRGLRSAKDKTLKEIRVDHLTADKKELIAVLARSIDSMAPESIEQLRKTLFKSFEEDKPFRRRHGMYVAPMSNAKLELLAKKVRSVFCQEGEGKIPIIEIVEMRLPRLVDGYVFDVRDRQEMGAAEGLVVPGGNSLILREDVYEGACRGEGRPRFTACHELGHFIMHQEMGLARVREDSEAIYCDAEWQADRFAGFLMMPRILALSVSDANAAADIFGMSQHAASVQLSTYKKH